LKNKRRKSIRFKGWDWTELLQLEHVATNWPKLPKGFKNTNYPIHSDEDAKRAYLIREYLKHVEIGSREEKVVAKYIRRFLTVLAQQDKAWGRDEYKVYRAMASMDDFSMLRWVSPNLEFMWT